MGRGLHEGSEVLAVERRGTDWMVRTRRAQVRADAVLLACNGYLRGIAHEVEKHVMPINNFIAVTEPLGEEHARSMIRGGIAVSDSRFVVNYFRMTADHRLLFGGGENYRYGFPQDIKSFVRKRALQVFPQLRSTRFDFGWGGTLAITPTRMPFIREIRPGFYNASGFQDWAFCSPPIAARSSRMRSPASARISISSPASRCRPFRAARPCDGRRWPPRCPGTPCATGCECRIHCCSEFRSCKKTFLP